MSETLSQIQTLLQNVVLPNLKGIMAGQAEQRIQTDRLHIEFEEFRSEMLLSFAEIRAELAALRTQVEDAMVTLSEGETAQDSDDSVRPRKSVIH